MKKCDCGLEFEYVSVTPLQSEDNQKFHIQTNCLNCGTGWGTVSLIDPQAEKQGEGE